MEAVFKAVREGKNVEELTPLLVTVTVDDLNKRVNGKHILQYAIEDGASLEVIHKLIEKGAKVNEPSQYGFSALTWAAMNNNVLLMNALIEAGADVNQEGYHKKTALEMAGRSGSSEAVALLLAGGAAITVDVRAALSEMPEPIRAAIQAEIARRADEAAAAVGNVQPAIPSAVLGRIANFLKGGRRKTRRGRRVRWARKTRCRRGI